MSLKKENKPHPSVNRSNDTFIRPSATQIAKMNKENPERKVTNSAFDPEVKLNHFGEPAFIQPNNTVQARLKMGQANDKYEKEADSVADKVVNHPMVHGQDSSIQKQEEKETKVQEKSIGETISPLVQKMETEAESVQRMDDEEVQQKKNMSGIHTPSNIEGSLKSSKGRGSKMDGNTKSQMESGFGKDFSDVNIHTDSNAVQMSEEIGAKAFTNGNDVYFNEGQYNPASKEGKHLLAHELTHTVQQGKNSGKNDAVQRDIKDKGANMAVPNGQFEIDMTATSAFDKKKDNKLKRTGEQGFIRFTPSPKSPVANVVSLIQIVKSTKVKKVKEEGKKIEKEVNSTWYKGEADRMEMRTSDTSPTYTTLKHDTLKSIAKAETAGHVTAKELYDLNAAALGKFDENKAIPEGTALAMPGSEEGYFLDHKAASNQAEPRETTADPDVSLFYKDYFPGASNVNGHKNSYQTMPASIGDWPGIKGRKTNTAYQFETVARSVDQGFDYGTLFWGFEAKNGVVTNEYHYVKEGTSSTFKSGIAEFNKFYGNHHTLMKGETLQNLARLYLGDESKSVEIEKANPSMLIEITPGQKLTIPGAKNPHKVRKGDTVEMLALRYLKDKNKTADIEKANPSMTTRLALGQKIIIPGKTNETKP